MRRAGITVQWQVEFIHYLSRNQPCFYGCGIELPGGDDDVSKAARIAHKECCPALGSKLTPAHRTMVIVQPMNYSHIPTPDLQALRLRMKAKLALTHNRQLDGTQRSLQQAYNQILDAASAELERRGA